MFFFRSYPFLLVLAFLVARPVWSQGESVGPSIESSIERKGTINPRAIVRAPQWNPRLDLIEPIPVPGKEQPESLLEKKRYLEKLDQMRSNPSLQESEPENLEFKTGAPSSAPGSPATNLPGTPLVGDQFQGPWTSSFSPPDNAVAVGEDGTIVALINSRIQFVDPEGNQLLNTSCFDFFSSLSPGSSPFDPRVIYAPNHDCFVVAILHGSTVTTSKIYLAFSSTSDPMDPWNFYELPGDACSPGDSWTDYPNMGMTQNELFLTGNLFTVTFDADGSQNNSFDQSILWKVDVPSGMFGLDLPFAGWCGLETADGTNAFTMLPAQHAFGGTGTEMWMVARGEPDKMYWWRMTGTLGTEQTITAYGGSVPTFANGTPCPQLDENNPLDNGGTRLRSAFMDLDYIYCTHNIDRGEGWNGIRVYKISHATQAITYSDILGLSGYDYTFPTIQPWASSPSTWDGSLLLGFMRVSGSSYPELRAVVVDADLTFNGSFQIQEGTSAIQGSGLLEDGVTPAPLRWGDYIDAQWRSGVDHAEVWISGHVGESNSYRTYHVQVADELLGCTNPLACNFNQEATISDGSCTFTDCYGCMDPTACNFDENADFPSVCTYPGCTDFWACNFDANAACDDGSCCYGYCLTLTMEDGYGDGWNGATYAITNTEGVELASGTMVDGELEVVELDCAASGCYNMTVTAGTYPFEISWSIATSGGGFPLTGFGSSVVELASGGGNQSVDFTLGNGGSDGGCTDEGACNYDAEAMCDNGTCCYASCYTVAMEDDYGDGWTGSFWEITDLASDEVVQVGTLSDYAVGYETACLADGCYSFAINFENGTWAEEINWTLQFNGEDLAAGGAENEFTFMVGDGGGTGGCTDPAACNFDQGALCDDGSCCYENCGTLLMLDGYGDGWNGGQVQIWTPEGMLMQQFTLENGESGETSLCLEDGCYVVQVEAGYYPDEVSWLMNVGGAILGGGMFAEAAMIGVNSVVGCTDIDACNYNANATCDDGSCLVQGCTDSAACNYDTEAYCGASELCDFACYGCTYSNALNFDPGATMDDGLCEFPVPEDPACLGDLNGDSLVSISDLLALLAVYGDGCE